MDKTGETIWPEHLVHKHANGQVDFGPLDGNKLCFSSGGKYLGMPIKDRNQASIRKAQTKNRKGAIDKNGRLTPVAAELCQLNHVSKNNGTISIVRKLTEIMTAPSTRADRLIDEFASTLKAARRLNLLDGSTGGLSVEFIEAIEEFCKKEGRPPTKSELAMTFCKSIQDISKLCASNRFEWLRNKPGGRHKELLH